MSVLASEVNHYDSLLLGFFKSPGHATRLGEMLVPVPGLAYMDRRLG